MNVILVLEVDCLEFDESLLHRLMISTANLVAEFLG